MKKIILIFLLFNTIILAATASVASAFQDILVFVNGNQIYFPDQKPYINEDNRTLVPVRFVSEALNAEVEWDGAKQEVTITGDGRVVQFVADARQGTVNGIIKTFDTALNLTSQGRVMVPLRFVSEEIGAVVEWDEDNRIVYIFNQGQSKEEMEKIMNKANEYEWQNGYQIPKDTEMKINVRDLETEPNRVDISWLIYLKNEMHPYRDMGKQYEQSYTMLSSKFGSQVADEVVDYINTKDVGTMELPRKWWVANGQTISVASNWGSPSISITIWAYEATF